jgi:hypothetical protein
VDKGADGRRAFHRIGEPDVERDLRALADGTREEQVRDGGHGPGLLDAEFVHASDLGEELVVLERAELCVGEEQAEGEAEVTDAVDDERLLAGGDGGGLLVVEADEVVGAEADTFPAKVEQKEVVGHDEGAHGEDEEAEPTEEACVASIAVHVLAGVERDERAEARNEEHPQHGEAVDVEGEVGEEALRAAVPRDADPLEEMDSERLAVGDVETGVDGAGHDEGDGEGNDGQPRRELRANAHSGAERTQHRSEERQQQDEAGHRGPVADNGLVRCFVRGERESGKHGRHPLISDQAWASSDCERR